MKNLLFNKIRIGVALQFTTLGFFKWVAPIKESYMSIISSITIGLLFITVMIVYNEITFIPFANKKNIINLLYFHHNFDFIQG